MGVTGFWGPLPSITSITSDVFFGHVCLEDMRYEGITMKHRNMPLVGDVAERGICAAPRKFGPFPASSRRPTAQTDRLHCNFQYNNH